MVDGGGLENSLRSRKRTVKRERVAPPRPKAVSLARLVAFAPPVAALIAAENRASRWWPLRFPRSPLDFDRDSTRLFTLLTTPARGLLAPIGSSNTQLVEQTRSGQLTNEPDKNRTTGVFNLVIEDDGHRHSLRVITKFQSGRGMPLYMQAIRAVAEHGIAREIEFYRRLASVVPIEVPRPLFADSVTVLNRVCLVLEYVDGDNQPDWRGCSLAAIQVLLANAARLNASLFDRLTDPTAAWIPARTGLEFADYVTTFIGKHEPWYRRIWTALQVYFEGSPVTLVHGDCRPGNMLFRGVNIDIGGGDEDAESEWPATPPPAGAAVVMCDWEAVNVAPLLWDFTYCTIIGLRVADRRAWQTRLLQQFLGHLGPWRSREAPDSARGSRSPAACDRARLPPVIKTGSGPVKPLSEDPRPDATRDGCRVGGTLRRLPARFTTSGGYQAAGYLLAKLSDRICGRRTATV